MTGTVSPAVTQGVMLLADWGNKDLTGGRGAEFGKASPVGLLLILALLVGIVLLVRSMNRHLRKIPKSFDEDGTEGAAGQDGGGPDGPGGPVASGSLPPDSSAPGPRGSDSGGGTGV